MSDDLNARDFQASTFIKKDMLKREGPRRLPIRSVEAADGLARNGKPPRKILVLTFTDETRFGLSANVNLQRVIELFGERTANWIGKTVELYFSPDVPNPSGGEAGGIRVRPAAGSLPAVPVTDFTAVLTKEARHDDPF